MSRTKVTKITPGSNLMWESSRFVLPEQKDLIQRYKKEERRKDKPCLTDDSMHEISDVILSSYINGFIVSIVVYDPFDNYTVTGKVSKIDTIDKKVKINDRWFFFGEIMKAEN